MRSGAPGGSWGYVRRPAWRRSGRVERGRAGAGGCRSSRFEVVELHRSSSGRWVEGCRLPSLRPGLAFAPPPRWAASSLVWPGVRDRWELLPPWPRPPPLPRADWHELCQGGAPPPAFRTDVRSGGGIPNPALTHPSDNAGANPLTKGRFQ